MHPLLLRQIDRLGLSVDTPPDAAGWRRLLERIGAAYTQADESRGLVERSMELSSTEMQALHTQLREANDALESKVRERTDALERLNADLHAEVEVRRRAEEALAVGERWLRLINDSLAVMIAYVDTDGRYRYCNRAFRSRIGGDGEIVGRHVREVLGEAAHDAFAPLLRAVLDGVPARAEYVMLDGAGHELHLGVDLVPDRDADGVVRGGIALLVDVTAVRRAEQAAREAREMLASIVDAVPDPIFVKDEAHRFLLVNDAGTQFFGHARDAMIGRSDPDFFPPDQAAHFWRKDDETFASARDIVEEEPITDAGGRLHTISTKKRAIQLPDGRRALVGVIRDISSLKQQQAYLAAARDAAEAASRAKSEFLARMSHEIRTPMNGVLGMTEVLRGTPLSGEQRDIVDTVYDSGVALLRVINDILDFSKVEAGRLELERIAFDLPGCVRGAAGLLRERAAAKGLALEIDIGADVPRTVRGDPGRLRQILTNLIGNAIKFTERGRVLVRLDLDGRLDDGFVVRCEVSDTGIGIAAEAQAMIFDAFSQADGGITRRYGGTGLGLAICRQLVQLMGGDISVDSRPGAGATFRFTMQLEAAEAIHADAGTPDIQPARESPETPAGHDVTGASILVAEDNPVNRQVALAMLRSLGCCVDVAVNGREAVDATARKRYDVVLMDCQMPDMDGLAATAAIRARDAGGQARPMPIVALTANAMQGDREACIRAGMDDYLSKPFSREQLRAVLGRWVSSPRDGAHG